MAFINVFTNNSIFKHIHLFHINMLIIFLLVFIIPFISYANTPNIMKIKKTGEHVIPSNQSKQDIEKYLISVLSLEASREAGVAIFSSTTLVDNKISEEVINEQNASVNKIKTLKSEVFNKNNESYLRLEIEVEINTNDLKQYLEIILGNNELQKEITKLNKEVEKLKKQIIKKGNKNNDKFLKEYEKLLKEQEERMNKIRKDIDQANIYYREREKESLKQKAENEKKLALINQKSKEEQALAELKIQEEKNQSFKNDLLFQKQLLELKNNANINEKELITLKTLNNIDNITQEAAQRRKAFASLIDQYNNLNIKNKNDLKVFYDGQIKIITESKFIKSKPVKDEWETSKNFKARKKQYELDIINFDKSKKLKIKQLQLEYKEKLISHDIELKKEMINSLAPLYQRFIAYKTEYYVSNNEPYLKYEFYGKDIDNMEMAFKVLYKSRKYDFKYKFDSMEDFKIMYNSKNSFRIFATYSVVPKGKEADKVLRGFKLLHLGTLKEKDFFVNHKVKEFPEIEEYNKLLTLVENDKLAKNKKIEKEEKEEKSKNYRNDPSRDYKYHILSFDTFFGFGNKDNFIIDVSYKHNWELTNVFALYLNLGVDIIYYSSEKTKNNTTDNNSSSQTSSDSQNKIDSDWGGLGLLAGLGARIDLTSHRTSSFNRSNFYLVGEANFNPVFTMHKDMSTINAYIKAGLGYGIKIGDSTVFALEVFFGTLIGKNIYPGVGVSLKI